MAIADRINEMYTHVGDVYDTLEVGGAQIYTLPNEFTQVDYIQSSGTQYIDTGVKAYGLSTNYEIEFTPTYLFDFNFLLSARESSSSRRFDVGWGSSGYGYLGYNNGSLAFSGMSLNKTKITKNQDKYYVNDEYIDKVTLIDYSTPVNLTLFANNNNGTLANYAHAKLYRLKLYEYDRLIRDFIPCYRNSDNVVGLYDIVEGNFYTNKGTGVFTYGSVSREHIDKNIININAQLKDRLIDYMNNGTEKIWNNWEKVTGSGTDISLSPTLEAPMRNVLNGNTYQFTTTGKNLLENTFQSQTANGITFTRNEDGSLSFSGTATQAHSITGRFTNEMIFRAGVTYIFSLGNKQAGYGVYLQKTGNVNVWYLGVSVTNSSLTITPTEDTTIQQLAIHFPNGNTVNGTIYPMVRLSSVTDSTYEPYTGGQASPNPQYPQDIHVVSGDNTINVCGKNILDLTSLFYRTNGIISGDMASNSFVQNGTASWSNTWFYYKNDKKNTNYTLSMKALSSLARRTGFSVYGVSDTEQATNPTIILSHWLDISANVKGETSQSFNSGNYEYIMLRFWNNGTATALSSAVPLYISDIQLEYGTSVTDFEPYQGNTYNIDLPIENLFDTSLLPMTKNGVTISKDDEGNVVLNGTPTITSGYIGFDFTLSSTYLKAGTYTSSIKNKMDGIGITINQTTPGGIINLTMSDTIKSKTGTLTADLINGTIGVNVRYDVGTLTNFILNPQLEIGSKAHKYTPYGTTPIELCDFNTYKDNFLRTSGKNLFDDTYNDLGMWTTNIGDTTTFAQGSQYLGAYCKVEPGTYTISRNKKTNRFRIGVSPNQPTGTTSSCYVVASNDNASSITIDVPQGNNYICVYLSNNSETSTNVDLMIEKGSSASDYEPYGSGEWYTHKELGKAIIDENIVGGALTDSNQRIMFSSSSNPFLSNVYISTPSSASNLTPSLSNYFSSSAQSEITPTNNKVGFSKWGDTTFVYFSAIYNSVADFKTWLSTHNVVVYYVLATPNYNKITYEPLLEQLETFYNAKSKNSQTNITQENNDLPFIIDSTMLKEV